MSTSSRRGLALLVTLAILSVLAIVAVCFARMMRVESSAADTHSHSIRAGFAAEAGIEFATRYLARAFESHPWGDPRDGWVFRNASDSDVGTGLDLVGAAHPSAEAGVYPPGHVLAGQGYSGLLSPSNPEVTFALKIESNSGKIHVNGGDPAAAWDVGYNKVLARFLDDFVLCLKRDATYPSDALPDDAGQRILQARPSSGYSTEEDLAGVLGERAYRQLVDFVCVQTWVDPAVIEPDPMTAVDPMFRRRDPRGRPYAPRIQPRAPIDVNLAPVPVLAATLVGLQARVLERKAGWWKKKFANQNSWESFSGLEWRVSESPAITHDQAHDLAVSIALERESRGPFKTWQDFGEWLDGLWNRVPPASAPMPWLGWWSLPPVADGDQVATDAFLRTAGKGTVADVVRAAVDPNTRLNKNNPDLVLYRTVDKTDLVAYKTEFCLGPTGYFRIQSIGRVVAGDEFVAQAGVRVVHRVFCVVRHTTQADFEANHVDQGARDDDVLLLPEATGDSRLASTIDGQVTLAPNGGSVVGPGEGELTFRPGLQSGYAADVGTPGALHAHAGVDAGRAVVDSLLSESDLVPEYGFYGADEKCDFANPVRQHEHLIYTATDANRGWEEGALEFWYKPSLDWETYAQPEVKASSKTGALSTATDRDWDDQANSAVTKKIHDQDAYGNVLRIYQALDEKHVLLYTCQLERRSNADPASQLHTPTLRSELRIYDENQFKNAPHMIVYSGPFLRPRNDPILEEPMFVRSDRIVRLDDGRTYREDGVHQAAWPNASRNSGSPSFGALRWKAGEWHHVAVRWWNATEHRIWIDGREVTFIGEDKPFEETKRGEYHTDLKEIFSVIEVGSYFKPDNYSYKTSERWWYIEGTGNGTVSMFRIYRPETTAVPSSGDFPSPRQRYYPPVLGSGTYRVRFAVPAGRRLGTIAWTELRPRTRYEFDPAARLVGRMWRDRKDNLVGAATRPNLTLRLQLDAAASFTDIDDAGDGQGAGIASETKDGWVTYEVAFDSSGLEPFDVVAYLDDVTLTWIDPRTLSWRVDR